MFVASLCFARVASLFCFARLLFAAIVAPAFCSDPPRTNHPPHSRQCTRPECTTATTKLTCCTGGCIFFAMRPGFLPPRPPAPNNPVNVHSGASIPPGRVHTSQLVCGFAFICAGTAGRGARCAGTPKSLPFACTVSAALARAQRIEDVLVMPCVWCPPSSPCTQRSKQLKSTSGHSGRTKRFVAYQFAAQSGSTKANANRQGNDTVTCDSSTYTQQSNTSASGTLRRPSRTLSGSTAPVRGHVPTHSDMPPQKKINKTSQTSQSSGRRSVFRSYRLLSELRVAQAGPCCASLAPALNASLAPLSFCLASLRECCLAEAPGNTCGCQSSANRRSQPAIVGLAPVPAVSESVPSCWKILLPRSRTY